VQEETSKATEIDLEKIDLSPLYVIPSTPHTRGHLPLQELGIPEEEEEEVLDLTKITFDQVSLKIRQERRKYYARNPIEPLSITIAKEIVPDTIVIPI